MSQNVNIIALSKGVERYVFLYHDSRRDEALHTLGRFAANSDLGFTWYDAAVLSKRIREQSRQPANRLPT